MACKSNAMPDHSSRTKAPPGPVSNPNPTPGDIRAVREAAGLTQCQAAALIYRTARNWQQWEGGERRMDPALWELFRLKSTLNIVRN
jgi:putative transcriptional regulator